jgi:hypothetical protein
LNFKEVCHGRQRPKATSSLTTLERMWKWAGSIVRRLRWRGP